MGVSELTVDTWDGYAARWTVVHGGMDPRGALPPVRGWMRVAYLCGVRLVRRRISVGVVTFIRLVSSLAAPLAMLVGGRWAIVSATLVLGAAFAEALEGAVGVVTGRATSWGTVRQAAVSRISEAGWLAALWLAGAPGWLAVGACGVAWLHEHTRLQATMAGVRRSQTITMGERPMRVAVVGVGLALSGVAALYSADLAIGAATMAGAVWLLLGVGSLIQLADGVHSTLGSRRC